MSAGHMCSISGVFSQFTGYLPSDIIPAQRAQTSTQWGKNEKKKIPKSCM